MVPAITHPAPARPTARRSLGAVVIAMVIGSGVPGTAHGAPQEITLREGANLSVTTSATGDRLAFDLVGRIWALDPDTGHAEQLSADDEIARLPALSPDGRYVAYETIRDGYRQIMVRDADGSRPRQITFGEFNHRTPMWSPRTGTRRLIMSSDRSGSFGIWEVDIDTLDLRQLTFASGDEREPAWNADGSELAYVSDTQRGTAIFAVRPGEAPRQLLVERAKLHAPAWRPGGGVLTYVRSQRGERQLRMLILSQPAITKPITGDEDVFPHRVAWVDRATFWYAADGRIRRRHFGERDAQDVAFTAQLALPSGRRAGADRTGGNRNPNADPDAANHNRAVVGTNGRSAVRDGRYVVSALGDLWEIAESGALLRQLTNDPYVDAHPSLSPDGMKLAYISDRGGSLQVWLRDLETQRERRLTRENGIALYPVWTDDGEAIEYMAASHAASTELIRKRITIATRATERLDAVAIGDLPRSPNHTADDAPLPLTWHPFRVTGRTIVRAGRIFDGLGPGYLAEHEIVIEGDRIVEVRPWTTGEDGDTRTIDARDRTVIPGLIDLSTRQGLIGDERLGRQWLAYGVTTIREAVTAPAEAIARRESWHSGRRIGPRLMLTPDDCTEAPPGIVARPVLEPAIERRYLEANIARAVELASASIELCAALNIHARADLIAIAHASGLAVGTAEPFPDLLLGADETRLPPPGTAGYEDFPVVAGALGAVVTTNLAAAGLPGLVHRGELPAGWQFSEVFTNAERGAYADAWILPAAARDSLRADARAARLSLLGAAGRGARVVTGSDAPVTPAGLGLHAELRLLAQAGLQTFQILRMATLDAGRALGEGDQLGAIRAGYLADLVIIDGDPLGDIRAVTNVTMTMIRGRPYSRRELSEPGGRPASVGNFYN